MKITRAETVVRYQVSFTPREVEKLCLHTKWRNRIGIRPMGHGAPRFGDAMLTKTEINDVCDVLGINGREIMSKVNLAAPSSTDISLGLVDAKTGERR